MGKKFVIVRGEEFGDKDFVACEQFLLFLSAHVLRGLGYMKRFGTLKVVKASLLVSKRPPWT